MGVFRLLAPLQRHKLCGDMLAKSTTGTLRLIKTGVVRQSLTGLKAPPYFMYLSIGLALSEETGLSRAGREFSVLP